MNNMGPARGENAWGCAWLFRYVYYSMKFTPAGDGHTGGRWTGEHPGGRQTGRHPGGCCLCYRGTFTIKNACAMGEGGHGGGGGGGGRGAAAPPPEF
jgi:hypothetical protein